MKVIVSYSCLASATKMMKVIISYSALHQLRRYYRTRTTLPPHQYWHTAVCTRNVIVRKSNLRAVTTNNDGGVHFTCAVVLRRLILCVY